MLFRVLGSLEIEHDGRMVELGSPRLRNLLAALLLRPNRVVTTDRLIAEIWDGAPPSEPRGTLQAHVYRLRRALPAGGDAHVRTRPAGYLLETPPGSVDVDGFLDGMAAGRSAAREGDHAEAVRQFGAGLGLWRGPAFDGISARHVRAEARRLEDVRMAVVEEKLTAELALGRHHTVLPELDALVAEHPYRERLWAALMVALYRSGRQAEALAAYDSARRRMVDGVGLEPGAELRSLHEQVLAGAQAETLPPAIAVRPAGVPALGIPAAGTPAVATPGGPAELPPDVRDFTGRREELRTLRHLLLPDQPVAGPSTVVISGLGGVGRTALAVHAAHGLADRFPDGALYAQLDGAADSGPVNPAAVLGRWLRVLGVRAADVPVDANAASALFRSVTAGRQLLLVLDDAAGAAQVRPLLPAAAGCAVLVTASLPLATLEGAHGLRLPPLSEPDAVTLLSRLLGLARAAAEPEAVVRIARRCGGLPVALRVVAARMAIDPQRPAREMADRLVDDQSVLDELSGVDLSVRAAFRRSCRALGADPLGRRAAQVLGLLGMLDRTDVDRRSAALVAAPGRRTDAVLERLVAAGLLDAPSSTTYRMHTLVRLYARERALAAPDHGSH